MALFRVREAKCAEVATIAACQLLMAQETEGVALDLPTVERGVTAVFDDPAKGRYYVAEAGEELVGCMLTIPEWSDWRAGTILWIHSVYVLPEWRRKGVFRGFYEHLREMVLRDDALKGLRLYVDRRNTRAQQTYQALGMTDEHYQTYEWMK